MIFCGNYLVCSGSGSCFITGRSFSGWKLSLSCIFRSPAIPSLAFRSSLGNPDRPVWRGSIDIVKRLVGDLDIYVLILITLRTIREFGHLGWMCFSMDPFSLSQNTTTPKCSAPTPPPQCYLHTHTHTLSQTPSLKCPYCGFNFQHIQYTQTLLSMSTNPTLLWEFGYISTI